MQEPTLDERMQKFIELHGMKAWIEYLSAGKMPDQPTEKPDVKEWVKKIHGF